MKSFNYNYNYNYNYSKALFLLLLSLISQHGMASPRTILTDLTQSMTKTVGRGLNLSNLFGSATSVSSYDRLQSQPVFCVTTPWGSPYLLFERRDSTESNTVYDEYDPYERLDNREAEKARLARGGDRKEGKTHQVALYFCDEEDAMNLRDEMLQMEQMKGLDMRIASFSLGRAIRHASNLKDGLLTGQPINELTGNILGPEEGGVLRYKIVPSKRELYYAARCKGKERVGFFSNSPADDAALMLNSFPVIGATLLNKRKFAMEKRRKAAREAARGAAAANKGNKANPASSRTNVQEEDPIRKEYAHMEGFVGIPVFHSPSLKKFNKVKSLLTANKQKESPLFFSYEDLLKSWKDVRSKLRTDDAKSSMPEMPTDVEVFNVMDVVTSMDKDRWHTKRALQLRRQALLSKIPLMNRITAKEGMVSYTDKQKVSTGINQVVFVPNSKSVRYKNIISNLGNAKARGLRPMKPWGRDAM